MRRADVITGVAVTALGGFALVEAQGLSFYLAHVPGPGFFPVLLSVLLLALGAALTLVSLVRKKVQPDADADVETATSISEVARVGLVMGGFIACVALLTTVGFVPAMTLLALYLGYGVERLRGWAPLVAAVLIAISTYVLFGRLLGVQLPTGPLGY